MLFCQLAQAKSLREISDGLAVTCGKLSHFKNRLLRLNLFSYGNLWDWLDEPFETPPELPNPQLKLSF